MSQITTCSFYRVEGTRNKWWAFKQMRLGIGALQGTVGLSFSRLLGSGATNGFSAVPNFSTYVLFAVWESGQHALDFFDRHPFHTEYAARSTEQFNVFLRSAEAHGYWDGMQPFSKAADLAMEQPVVVLTRARIRFKKLWSFWSRVGKVSQSLEGYDGLALSIGVGEWPLIQQATISIWQTQAEMMDYAYKNTHHREVVKLTRQLNWYSEELFARFVPYRFEGRWGGKDVAQLLTFVAT
jgi:hypothetical protein